MCQLLWLGTVRNEDVPINDVCSATFFCPLRVDKTHHTLIDRQYSSVHSFFEYITCHIFSERVNLQ